jgi:hypothetical protein
MPIASTSVRTCPLVFRRPAKQAALKPGLREVQSSAAMPAAGDSMTMVVVSKAAARRSGKEAGHANRN